MSTSSRQRFVPITALIVATAVAAGVATEQHATSPRLCEGRVGAAIPRAFGGGEVVLELTVDSKGSVAEVEPVRATPPFLDFAVKSVTTWRFTPATDVRDGRVTTVAAPVLVVVVEIEIRRGERANYRIVGPASGFDSAALDAVRSWRFGPPQDSDVPDAMFAYAVLGFRAPLTLPAERPR